MAESPFTRSFKNALGQEVRTYLSNRATLEVGIDTKPFPEWEGRPDVWIRRNGGRGVNHVVAIEIEHTSNDDQTIANIAQAYGWPDGRRGVRTALVHLLHTNAKLSRDVLEMIDGFRQDLASSKFQYSALTYDAPDLRASVQAGKDIGQGRPFRTALLGALRFTGLLEGSG